MTQLNGNIVALRREREEDHRQDTLALWERSAKAATPELPWSSGDRLSVDDLLLMTRGAKQVVVSCSQQGPEVLKEFLARLSQQSATRVYLYGPVSWQDEKWLKALVGKPRGGLLARLGIEPPGDWVVADGRAPGRLFLGAPGLARRWAHLLDSDGARTLYQAFCWLFWHRATLEALPGTQQCGFQRCLPAPFPDPTSSHDPGTVAVSGTSAAGFSPLPATSTLSAAGAASRTPPGPGTVLLLARGTLLTQSGILPLLPFPELVVSPDGAPWPGTPAKVLTPHDLTDFDLLRQHSARGASLVWSGLDLPRLALTRQGLAIALEEGPTRLQLELQSQDAIALMHSLEEIERQPEWRFHAARKLADVKGSVWLEGARAMLQVKDRIPLNMGRLQALDLEATKTLEPSRWTRPDTPARVWHYTWEVEPPHAPEGAREARLVQDWRRLDEYVTAQGEALRRQLKAMEDEEASSGLLTRLTALLKPWESVKRRRRQIAGEVDELLEDRISRRPAEAEALLERLLVQSDALKALRQEARQTEEQEERRLEEETQRSKYERVRAEKKALIDTLSDQIRAMETVRQGKLAAKAQTELELSAQEKAWQDRLDAERQERCGLEAAREALKEEVRQLQERLTVAKNDPQKPAKNDAQKPSKKDRRKGAKNDEKLDTRSEGLNDERKRLEAELAQKHRALGQLKKQLEALATDSKPTPSVPEEHQVLRSSIGILENDLVKLAAEEAKLQQQLDAAHGEFNREFVFKPPAPSKRTLKLEDPAPRPAIPSEHPPEHGRLLEDGSTRYLEVDTWGLAEKARKVAERLGARLVAPAHYAAAAHGSGSKA